jgi:hypothetical protein
LLLSLLSLVCAACTHGRRATDAKDYVILAPDPKNDVIHEIAMDGTYEGDFLDSQRFENLADHKIAWDSPRGVLALDPRGERIWVTAERALSEWTADGKYLRTIYADSSHLEDPTGIMRIGGEVFVLSEDKKRMMVFGLDGTLLHEFGYPALIRAKDFKLGLDGMLYVGAQMLNTSIPGLVSVWDPKNTTPEAKPVRYRIPPDTSDDGTLWVNGLVFDDKGKLLVTAFYRGRVERWDLERNVKLDVLLDSGHPGTYRDIERGPDGLIYVSGPAGLYRFPAEATAADLKDLEPFFDASQLASRYEKEFTPTALVFVPRPRDTSNNGG